MVKTDMVRTGIPAGKDNAHGSERNVKLPDLRPLRPTRLPLREIGGDDPEAWERALPALSRIVVRAMRRRGLIPQLENNEGLSLVEFDDSANRAGEEVENL